MPTSETMVTTASVAIAVGLWYAAQSYVSPLLQIAVLATVGVVFPAIYRQLVASMAEWPEPSNRVPAPEPTSNQTTDSATDPTFAD